MHDPLTVLVSPLSHFRLRRPTTFSTAFRQRAIGLLALAATIGLWVPAPADAVEITWFGPSGNWSDVSRWYPWQLPAAGDVVWVKASSDPVLSVTYSSPDAPLLGTLRIDSLDAYRSGQLLQSQDLLQANEEDIGYTGRGAHAISAGSNVLGKLFIGYWGSANGTYDLSGTGSLQAGEENVGAAGTGTLNHTSGSNTVTGNLNVGLLGGSYGSYNLSGTATLSSNKLFVGGGGTGRFYQVGGVHSVAGDISLGTLGSGNGRYELSDDGALSAQNQVVGGGGIGEIVQTSGANYASGNLVLGFLGGSSGTYDLSGTGTLSAYDQIVGGSNYGHFIQVDGSNTVRHELTLGELGGAHGTYELSGNGELSAVIEYLGGFGVGVLRQSGGTNTISAALNAGVWGSAYGRYELSGTGVLRVPNMVLGAFGQGHFVQTGGTADLAGTLTLCQWPNSLGSYALSDGLLTVDSIDNRPGCSFDFSGGELDALTFSNAGQIDLGGAGVRVVTPVVDNQGAVYATDTEVSFPETFSNGGAYVSERADNDFVDLVISSGGYLSADADSRFFVAGNLNSHSTRSTLFETSLAALVFVVSDTNAHSFHQTGQDLGPIENGYVENFAWGKLSLDPGQLLSLSGGPGALYVRVLALAGGVDQIGAITSDGANLYYDAAQAENGYLGGATYPLTGGGAVTPVPEPSLVLGLATGLVGLRLADARRRRRLRD